MASSAAGASGEPDHQGAGSTSRRCRASSATRRWGVGKAASTFAKARSRGSPSSPKVSEVAKAARARTSPALSPEMSRPQPWGKEIPPSGPGLAVIGTPTSCSASTSRRIVRSETSRRAAKALAVRRRPSERMWVRRSRRSARMTFFSATFNMTQHVMNSV